MKIKQVILVSGLSGAGKSSVMTILEDNGYLCIDNFPLELLATLLQWIEENKDPRYYYLALSTTAKDFGKLYQYFEATKINFQALFLDAANDVLIQRYQFTRNRHPFIVNNQASTLLGAINMERRELSGLADDILRIDTSSLSIKSLKTLIETNFNKNHESYRLSISFISFGFRNGLPLDADIVFDARFINNPYWVEELRKLTGNDKEVVDYVFADKRTEIFINKIKGYLGFSFAEFIKDQKSHVTVAVGCTGGKHRSVALVNYLAEAYQDEYHVLKMHRDLTRK